MDLHRQRRHLRRTLSVALALSGLFAVSRLAGQQSGAITGTVRDEATQAALDAAQVFIPGTGFSAVTNAEGGYALAGVPAGSVELRVVRLGYATVNQTVQVQAGQTVAADFLLQVSAVGLDELVVTVTGLQRRRELGNAAVTLQAPEELAKAAPADLTALLQGRAPGVTVLQSSGTVGAASVIRIRGNTSISLDNTPLIYVDGTRISNDVQSGPGVGGQTASRLNDLNLDDIESVEIVKGPSAATLYGVEAAAGVILITTKQGRRGVTEWTLRSEVGANWDATAWPETVWNPRAFFGATLDVSDLYAPGELPQGVYFADIPDTLYSINLLRDGRAGEGDYGTPWRTGLEQVHSLSLEGGQDNLTYFLSGELTDREGSLSNNNVTLRNMRANVNVAPNPRVDISVSTTFGSHELQLPDNDNNTFGYLGVALVGFPWDMPIRRVDPVGGGEWVTCPYAWELQRALLDAGLTGTLEELQETFCGENPFFGERTFDDVATLENQQKIERFTGSATVSLRPFDFLSARLTFGYDQFADQTGQFVPVEPEREPFGDLSRGFKSAYTLVERNVTLDASVVAGFDLTPDLHSTTSVGGQFFREKFEFTASVGRYLPPGSGVVSTAVHTEGAEGIAEGKTMGLFVQEQLGWRDRLFLTPAVRFDESSTFGERHGLESYPRIMASWVVSDEGWFDGLTPGFLQQLRLRGAWGESGKQPAAFAAVPLFSARRVTFEEQDRSGISLTRPGNPDLKPEKGREVELGFDAELMNGRVGIDFTWFNKVTTDGIVPKFLAPSTGYLAPAFTNIGELKYTGVELALDLVAWNTPALNWDWQLNVGTNKGEITELDEPIIYGLYGNSQRHQKGYPYASYFSVAYGLDSNGEVVKTDSAVFVGHPTPEMEGSISTTAVLGGWLTLHANLGFAMGHQQLNSTEEFRCSFLGGGIYGGMCPQLFEKDADGLRTDAARIKAVATEDLQYQPWIEDGDFARLRTVSARFELPGTWVGRLGATRGNFTMVAENLALFTSYSGLDPEVSFAGGDESTRAEFMTLPPAKRVTGRLSLTF